MFNHQQNIEFDIVWCDLIKFDNGFDVWYVSGYVLIEHIESNSWVNARLGGPGQSWSSELQEMSHQRRERRHS